MNLDSRRHPADLVPLGPVKATRAGVVVLGYLGVAAVFLVAVLWRFTVSLLVERARLPYQR